MKRYFRPGDGLGEAVGWSFQTADPGRICALQRTDPESGEVVLFFWSDRADPEIRIPVVRYHSASIGAPRLSWPLEPDRPDPLRFGRDTDRGITVIRDLGVTTLPRALILPYRAISEQGAQSYRAAARDRWSPDALELIRRLQEREAADRRTLESWIAEGDVRVHIKIPDLEMAFDLLVESTFQWQRGRALRWVHRDLYLDGVRRPFLERFEFPMIQPEKVLVLPLEIHLDREYRYRLEGKERIGDRSCFRLAFEPLDPESGRHSGVVWIDRRELRRVRQKVVQTGLEPPVISHVQVQDFGDLDGAWLPVRLRSDVVTRTAGRSTWIEQTTILRAGRRNPEDLEERIAAADRSDRRIMMDTPQGFVEYRKGPGGRRHLGSPASEVPALVIGAIGHQGSEQIVPLLGLNYFDFDLFDTGIQTNLLFGGALLVGSAYRTGLAQGRLELGADLALWAIPLEDRVATTGMDRSGETVDRTTQGGALNLTWKLAPKTLLKLTYGLEHWNFERSRLADPAFRTPSDTWVHSLCGTAEYGRRDWTFKGWMEWQGRDRWRDWGQEATSAEDLRRARRTWRAGAELELDRSVRRFQRCTATLGYRGGGHLDRFSSHGFAIFGDVFRGYGGADFHAAELVYLKSSWGWRAGPVYLGVYGDLAWARRGSLGRGWEPYPGLGLGIGSLGPLQTQLQLEAAYGFRSLTTDGQEGAWGGSIRLTRLLDIF